MTSKEIERLPFIVENLKREILQNFNLTWSEYLILSYLSRPENTDYPHTPQSIITALDMNRGWIYQKLAKLHDKAYISVSEGKPFKPGLIFLAPLGRCVVKRVKGIIGRMSSRKR